MTPALKKKELRRNPLAEWLGIVFQYFEKYRRVILAGVVVIVVVLAAAGAYSWYWIHQGQLARVALAHAEEALRTEAPGAPANTDEAMKRFEATAKGYAGTDSAQEALIRLGNLQYEAGKMDEARATYAEYLKTYPRGRYLLMAAIGKAYVDESKGDYQAGVDTLSKALDRAKNSPLAGEGYYDLARLYEEMKKPEDALRVYNQIVEGYSKTFWAQQALQRIASLKTK